MAGERVEGAELGWHGVEGDRRVGVRRTRERSGFPWLTASKLPDLLLFKPLRHDADGEADLPTHVRTPEGKELVFGESDDGPRISVTTRDARCAIVNLDPDSGRSTPEVLKAVVRTNQNNAGVYGTVTRTGRVAIGQQLYVEEPSQQ